MKAAQCGEDISYWCVYGRDGGVCQICGQPVHADIKNPDPLSGCIDHKIPISRGGLHSMTNVQLAHLRCNSKKWSRTPEEYKPRKEASHVLHP
ncbi:MAG: HNH endonuclease [Chloroflexi bacterium]|nr:HNH endonuclease [Chloroflexota bacterium]